MNQPPSSYPALQQHPMAAVAPTGYPMQHPQQTQAQAQPMPYYQTPNVFPPQTRAPQIIHQPVQHGFGPVPLHAGAGAGSAMMMSPGLPQHSSGLAVGPGPHPSNFSNPPYLQSIPTTVGQQSLPQSPSSRTISALPQGQPQTMSTVTAANSLFSTPPRPSQAGNQPQPQPQPQSPVNALSPQQTAREKARVSILLDINSALLQEVVNLQAAGKAGNQPASQQASPVKENSTASPTSTTDFAGSQAQNAPGSASKPSLEYIDCMRRLQANLAYLATVADRAKKAGATAPQAPAIMTPPPNVAAVTELYAKLNELFPGAPKQGGPSTPQQQQLQQLQQQRQAQAQAQLHSPQGNGGPAPTSTTETAG
ncbi:hypothetical protein FQN51_007799 [Onygenales sp. PD_10]|nr:hypothetical protein FQN51_007799 [Onygenales sp. PD_10]